MIVAFVGVVVELLRQQEWVNALGWVMTQPGLLNGLPGGPEALFRRDDARLQDLLQRTTDDPTGLFSLLDGPRGH